MIDFKVQQDQCIECGLCAKDCPVLIIKLNPKPTIAEENESKCIQCQHCLAICPTAAISILGKKPEDSVSTKNPIPKAEEMETLMKTRRSIRKFKSASIDSTLIHHLLSVAGHAPTGHNSNSVKFHVTETIAQRDFVRDRVYSALSNAKGNEELTAKYKSLFAIQKVWETKNIDILFRNAPHILLASAPKATVSPVVDATVAMTYFELLANTNGIGTLWDGLAKSAVINIDPTTAKDLGVADDHVLAYIMIFGHPSVKYSRGTQSDGIYINVIDLP
ncbi:MAG: nitroreductase family protein [Hyphomicrobiales bacterium]